MKLVNLKRQTNEIIDKTKKKRKPEKSEHTDNMMKALQLVPILKNNLPTIFSLCYLIIEIIIANLDTQATSRTLNHNQITSCIVAFPTIFQVPIT